MMSFIRAHHFAVGLTTAAVMFVAVVLYVLTTPVDHQGGN